MSASCSTSYVIPLSIGCSYNTRFSSSSPSSLSSVIISGGRTASLSNLRLRLILDSAANHRAMSRVRVRIPWRTPWGTRPQRYRAAVSRVEPEPEADRMDDSKIKEARIMNNFFYFYSNTVFLSFHFKKFPVKNSFLIGFMYISREENSLWKRDGTLELGGMLNNSCLGVFWLIISNLNC